MTKNNCDHTGGIVKTVHRIGIGNGSIRSSRVVHVSCKECDELLRRDTKNELKNGSG